MDRLDIDFVELHNIIQYVRTTYEMFGLSFDNCTPTTIAGGVLAVCQNKKTLHDTIETLKELEKGYEQYYSPDVFNNNSKENKQ